MDFKLNLNIKEMPQYAKVIILVVPAVIIIGLFIFFVFIPKNEEIKQLNASIQKLDNEIASSKVKIRRLDELKAENERLKKELVELRQQLPEEKEVSILLKQVSDLGLEAGLEILLWKPEAKKTDPSGLYIEIPVKVEVIAGYHQLGMFYSSISQIKRIVNISGIRMDSPVFKDDGRHVIKVNFTASTFSASEALSQPSLPQPESQPQPVPH